MAVDFHPEVLTGARESRNRDAVRVIRCLDVERMMNLTEVPAAIERATSEVRQDLHPVHHVKIPDHRGSS